MQPTTISDTRFAAVANRIIHGLPIQMTGNMKTQHLGIYLAILVLNELNHEATTTAISTYTGMATTHTAKIANNLVTLGVVQRTKAHATHGKGHQNLYTPEVDLRQFSVPSPF
ncbi:hypothetical protein SAMN05444161_8916 [Rhizobiales bacterium GAS191]|nr:hypothetical protein SAMN05444161_8916 [Rhizobiales bacterium GAS191]